MKRPTASPQGHPVTDEPVPAPTHKPGRRRTDSRERLLAAAAQLFLEHGYINVSVDDIARTAAVSRMTFYRQFTDKVDLSVALFQREVAKARPRFMTITQVDCRDPAEVKRWLSEQFQSDHDNRGLLKVFSQATAEGAGFTEKAQAMIADYIEELGQSIEAFHLDPHQPQQRRRWLHAWLLIYEILDQSNHAALNSGIANDPLVIDILADRFLAFVSCGEESA